MVEPPLPLEAHAMAISLLPGDTTRIDGAFGTVANTTGAEGADGIEGPTLFVATTVNVYVSPDTRFVIVRGEVPVTMAPLGSEVAVYERIGAPPVNTGGVHKRRITEPDTSAVTPVGGPGNVKGVVIVFEVAGAPYPSSVVATTTNVYVIPGARPVKVSGENPVAIAPLGSENTV
jgi:hypothetical protein